MIVSQDRIRENRIRFDGLLAEAACERDDERAMALVFEVAKFASLNGVGLLASSGLEARLRTIAERLEAKSDSCDSRGGTLLVATELYPVGGHTKVLERLAGMLKDKGRVSVVLTASGNGYLPDAIRGIAAACGGEAVFLDCDSRLERAARLRTIAAGYDRVLLMVHPEDAISVVAFGTERFRKPVFYYNHANHTFWLGVSIADKVLDVNKWGADLCCRLRGVDPKNVESIGIPALSSCVGRTDGREMRRELGIGEGEKLVMAAGSQRKFRNFGRWRFGDFISDVLSRNPSADFLVVGAESSAYPEWQSVFSRFGRRIKLMPAMQHERLLRCFAASDVVVDSFPMSGWTSMMDAVRQNVATVYPAGVTGPMDYFADSAAFVRTADEAVSLIGRLLEDESARRDNVAEMTRRVAAALDSESFKLRLLTSLDGASEHAMHDFEETPEPQDSQLSPFIYSMTLRRKVKFSLPGFRLESVREGTSKYRELSLFGGRFVWRF